eukprot:TRINITY_DN1259_c0_g2_i1.p1 TRINITY_DN1259_c0_g2~~TRINITY_DN1259_c0_g2_i1.p1  ORF type:complete len:358 (-),score=55.03 TRINITY_DN1259_c0_g2_i1:225-1298(-)
MCLGQVGNGLPQKGAQRVERGAYCIRDAEGVEVYVLGKRLGSGQAGVVHECYDVATKGKLACKSIPLSILEKKGMLNHALKEIELMQKMGEHSNIVDLRGVYIDSFGMHLIIDLCDGGDLFAYLAKEKLVREPVVAELMGQMVQALAHIHAQGVIHRDIKPENILLVKRSEPSPSSYSSSCLDDPYGRVKEGDFIGSSLIHAGHHQQLPASFGFHLKLADFGLAIDIDQDERPRVSGFCGSPLYMAPEVIRGRLYGPEVDMWSAGVICFTALSGYMPFAGEEDGTSFQEILCSNVRSLIAEEPWSNVSQEAKDFVLRLLCHDQEVRMSAKEALEHPWLQRHSGGWCKSQCVPDVHAR